MKDLRTIRWDDGRVILIDQTKLPDNLEYIECFTSGDVADCIQNMNIRGAPAIGVAGAYGLALAAYRSKAISEENLLRELEKAASKLKSTRPTAVNLFWAVNRVMKRARGGGLSTDEIRRAVVQEALSIAEEDLRINKTIGSKGAGLLKDGATVLTHCNAGFLATSGEYGTALGIIRTVVEQGKKVKVIVTETRPQLQGARLTTWELKSIEIPFTLIADTAVGFVFEREAVDCVLVGADRIAANGDVANKIGTYTIAVLAKRHGIPFYVAAPTSTIDLGTSDGGKIKIEHRDPSEVRFFSGEEVAPEGVEVLNPAFDVTPAELITAIITERGVVSPEKVRDLFSP